jgi:hypothetical protein
VSNCKRYSFEATEASPPVREVFALSVASGKRASTRRQLQIFLEDKIALGCAGSLDLGGVSEMVKYLLSGGKTGHENHSSVAETTPCNVFRDKSE